MSGCYVFRGATGSVEQPGAQRSLLGIQVKKKKETMLVLLSIYGVQNISNTFNGMQLGDKHRSTRSMSSTWGGHIAPITSFTTWGVGAPTNTNYTFLRARDKITVTTPTIPGKHTIPPENSHHPAKVAEPSTFHDDTLSQLFYAVKR